MAKSRRKSRKRPSRSISFSSSSNQPRPLLIERLADAALIAGLFTVLAFSEIRFEGFETEKAALMPVFGGIILGSHIARLIRNRDLPWKQILLNPLVIGIIGIIITSTISSVLGFSLARSWFGEAERLSGLQTLLMYLLLFSQAVVAVDRLTPLLTPIIITISAPLCLSIFFARIVQEILRPGSTTGNPNYLSSWLVMSMLMLVILLFIRIRQSTEEWNWGLLPLLLFAPLGAPIIFIYLYIAEKNKKSGTTWEWHQWAYLTLVLGMIVFMTLTIVVVGSRAALLSYAIGGVIAIAIMLAVARQRQILMLFTGIIMIIGVGYVTVSNLIPPDLKSTGGIFRVLNLGDARRQELWGGAISIISQQDDPYIKPDGTPDALASVRPIIGYGLSVIPQTQGRFGATTHENQFVGSFHNHIFDYIVMTGYPGMLMYVVFYLGAIYITLKHLRLIRDDTIRWFLVMTMFAMIGIIVTPSLFPRATTLNVLPIGVSLGVLGGNFVWIAGQAFRKLDYVKAKVKPDEGSNSVILPQHMSDRQIMMVALLGVIILRWVDIQFSFVQAASEPLFWALAGLFLGHYFKLKGIFPVRDDAEISHQIADARPIDWQMGVMGTGIMILYGFGITINSGVYSHEIALDWIIWYITITLVIGYVGAFLVMNSVHQLSLWIGLATMIVWGVMLWIKTSMATYSGDIFDNAIAGQLLPDQIQAAFFVLSFTGVTMVILMLIVWAFYDNWRVRVQHRAGLVVVLVLATVGIFYYRYNYASSTLHAAGVGFMEEGVAQRDGDLFLVSDAAFVGSTALDPTNARMWTHYIGMMTQQHQTAPEDRPTFDEDIQRAVNAIIEYEPYYIHSLEWGQYSDFYEKVAGLPLLLNRAEIDFEALEGD